MITLKSITRPKIVNTKTHAIFVATALLVSISFLALQIPVVNADTIFMRQWASSATASSEYGNPRWAAFQATGEPNTFECDDIDTAWAAEEYDTVEWLEVGFETAVNPIQIRVHETYSGGQATSVELVTLSGERIIIPLSPSGSGECGILTIDLPANLPLINAVRINVDQTIYEDYYEVDAVELIGFSDDGITYPPDSRINWQHGELGGALFHSTDSAGNPAIDVYCWDGTRANLGMRVSELNMRNGMTATGCNVTFYILSDGVYQFNINYDGKLYEIECADLECQQPELRHYDPNE